MDFPGNSHNPVGDNTPKEKKDIQKVITGEVIQKPKSFGKRFRAIFFGGDFKGVVRYVTADVMIPAIKNVIVDSAIEGVKRLVYGEGAYRRRYQDPRDPRDPRRTNYAYNRIPERYRTTMLPDQPPYPGPRTRRPDASDVLLASREDAENVLERMGDIIDKYETASVADLHDLIGLPTTYVDNDWGWTRITGASIRQTREGFLLELPAVEHIK